MASHSIDTGDFFPGQKRAERESDYLPNLIIMLMVDGSMPPLLIRFCGLQIHKFIFMLDRGKNALHSVHVGIRG